MQLPDETIEYQYGRLLSGPAAEWTPLAELQAAHYLPEEKLDAIKNRMIDVRRQVMSERELVNPPARLQPLQPGFIDLPQKLLDGYRKKGDASELGHTIRLANRLRENVDRVVMLGIGGSYLGAKALFDSLCHAFHNELPPKMRMGKPRMYFEGNNVDNDSITELLELLENT